jgi:hypothetical protein
VDFVHSPPRSSLQEGVQEDGMPRTDSLRPSILPIALPALALLAFRSAPTEVQDVGAHPRFRTVHEDTGNKVFVGIRLDAPSPDLLLKIVETLADWVKAARRDAQEALVSGEWDEVHEIQLVVGNDAMHMTAAEFAQYVHDLRYRELGPRERRIAGR